MSHSNGSNHQDEIASLMQDELSVAIQLLCDAKRCAQDVGEEDWNFAVEISDLHVRGVTNTLLRWLEAKGCIVHRQETTVAGEIQRKFAPTGGLFSSNSCFVITQAGMAYANGFMKRVSHTGMCLTAEPGRTGKSVVPIATPEAEERFRPLWDFDRKQLLFSGKIVKEFKLPSPNQETILMAFEEDEWPARIDDPLPPTDLCGTKARLNNTIKSLNRNQKHHLLRFRGDGTGEGIIWEDLRRLTRSPA